MSLYPRNNCESWLWWLVKPTVWWELPAINFLTVDWTSCFEREVSLKYAQNLRSQHSCAIRSSMFHHPLSHWSPPKSLKGCRWHDRMVADALCRITAVVCYRYVTNQAERINWVGTHWIKSGHAYVMGVCTLEALLAWADQLSPLLWTVKVTLD